jgi:hypothetical protein
VLSERAIKELKTNTCSQCQTPYSEQDVVILNGNEEDTDLMRTRMEARVARLKAEKKDKKVKKEVKEIASTSTSASTKSEKIITPSTSKIPALKPGLIVKPTITSASLKREIITDVTSSDPNSKKIKKDYSIAKDPKATEVYKSIFTSHDSEKEQDRAHWITYNPFYN